MKKTNKLFTVAALTSALLAADYAIELCSEPIIRKEIIPISKNAAEMRILHLSDFHNNHLTAAAILKEASRLHPDYIFLTGDMIRRSTRDFVPIYAFLSELSRIAPTYACMGNHELDYCSQQYENEAKLTALASKTGIKLLRNETICLENGWHVSGYDIKDRCYRNRHRGFSGLEEVSAEEITRSLGSAKPNTILLAHNPFFFSAYVEWGSTLTLSGHVHGGMVRIRDKVALFSPTRSLFPAYSKGLYNAGTQYMNVSAGLDTRRLSNHKEMVLLELKHPIDAQVCEVESDG